MMLVIYPKYFAFALKTINTSETPNAFDSVFFYKLPKVMAVKEKLHFPSHSPS
jgi:hypothetical protein